MIYSQAEKDEFLECADSLKKYRRAELTDEKGNDILEILYTDLLPNEQILKQCIRPNTTFLIGRKGTGKSTIFLKMQQEIRNNNNTLSCYIDTNTVFESSKAQHVNADYLKDLFSSKELQQYLLERTFIQNVLVEVHKEIDKSSYGIIDKIKNVFGRDKTEIVKQKLEKLYGNIENNDKFKEIEIPLIKQVLTKSIEANEKSNKIDSDLNAGIGDHYSPKLGISNRIGNEQTKFDELEKNFSDIFLRVFQIKEIISQIRDILSLLEIKSLYILLDDFSEIEDDSMKTFVNVILAPLNNWSEEFIKFKVAAYPNRVYFGKIDKGKIDIIDLDFFNLYSQVNRDMMEERAIDFTKRLIEKRVSYFTDQSVDHFFDNKNESMEEYYELIFQISMNVPRIIGYILYYSCESSISYDTPITRKVLQSAAERYYEKNIEPFFDSTTYSLISYDEKISILQLKDLLNSIIQNLTLIRKRIIKNELRGGIYEEIRTNPHTSHYYFLPVYEEFIKTLELNFFISKYNEMSDRDGGKQSVYCINYGLAVKNNLRWGKPQGNKYRKYFISRPFDFNTLIDNFLKSSKTIKCVNPNCNKHFPFDQLKYLEFNKMQCPECHNTVEIISTSDSIRKELDKVDKSILLPKIEFSLLHEINKSENARPKEIAQELDCSYQLVGWKAKKLDEDKQLILRKETENKRRIYKLTEDAKTIYFKK